MARPQKIGLDYFPLNVDIDQDDKIAIIEAKHGILGFAIAIKLLMKIYSEGYYYDWTEKEQILFSKRVNVNINDLNVIINDCVKWGLFDEELFNKYKIMTSRGIQLRYFEAVKRRKRVEIAKQYLMLTDIDINTYTNIVIVNINEEGEIVNVDINPQSKVKESKVKYRKVKVKYSRFKVKDSSATAADESENKLESVAQVDADSTEQINKPVTLVGADPIKQDDSLSRIENYYLTEVRKRIMCSSKDRTDMVHAYETYKDIDFIISVLKSATEENILRNGKCKINSFSYFFSIFEERWEELHAEKQESETNRPRNKANFKKSQAVKTRFHNFEGRSEQYSPEELNAKVEDISERKRKEARERRQKEEL